MDNNISEEDIGGVMAYVGVSEESTCINDQEVQQWNAAGGYESLDPKFVAEAKDYADRHALPWPPPDIDSLSQNFPLVREHNRAVYR